MALIEFVILIRNPWFEGGTVQESRNIYSTSPYLNSVTKIDKISQRIDGKVLQMSSACLVHTPDQEAISCLVKDKTRTVVKCFENIQTTVFHP